MYVKETEEIVFKLINTKLLSNNLEYFCHI